ncbi:hypothetical protein REPUB_Repub18cG0155300 [Reevesia pubescens]
MGRGILISIFFSLNSLIEFLFFFFHFLLHLIFSLSFCLCHAKPIEHQEKQSRGIEIPGENEAAQISQSLKSSNFPFAFFFLRWLTDVKLKEEKWVAWRKMEKTSSDFGFGFSKSFNSIYDTSKYGIFQLDNGLALTLQMGDALISTGLVDLGYVCVNIGKTEVHPNTV